MTNSRQVQNAQDEKDAQVSEHAQEIRKPCSLMRPLRMQNKIMMGAGPGNCTQRILEALAQPIMAPAHQLTFQLMDEIKEGLQYLFQTRNELTVAVTGSGNAGMETALCNLIEPKDTVLIAANGFWGERAQDMAIRQGAIVHLVRTDYGCVFDINDINEAIMRHRPSLMFITHGESSTGVLQPLDKIGKLCRACDCLLVVDAVATLGAVSVLVDKWLIDCAYSASQKALDCAPGLAPITFSPFAVKKIESRKQLVSSFFFDMKLVGQFWNCFPGRPRKYHHTLPINLLYALREGMSQIVEEGLDKCIARHQSVAKQLQQGLTQLGFELLVSDPSSRLPTVTAIRTNDSIDWDELRSYCFHQYHVNISPALGPTPHMCIRIGTMGSNANPNNVKLTLMVLEKALLSVRRKNSIGGRSL